MSRLFKKSVAGTYPIKIKHAFTSNLLSLSLVLIVKDSKKSSFLLNSTTSLLYKIFIFFLFKILLTNILSPRSTSLLLIIVTLLHISERYKDSSKALFPPPIIETSWFLKSGPSHKEQ